MDASSTSSTSGRIFLSPGDLCARWQIDYKTLNKFKLPWIQLSDTIRRIELSDVEAFERANRMTTPGCNS